MNNILLLELFSDEFGNKAMVPILAFLIILEFGVIVPGLLIQSFVKWVKAKRRKLMVAIPLALALLCGMAGYKDKAKSEFKILASDSFHIDSIPGNSMVTVSPGGISKAIPCPLDTMRGIMMWNDPNEYGNEGNMWDHGYYVGLCGPTLGMPVDSVFFFAGIMPRTYSMAECDTCTFHIYHERYVQKGKFFDSQWRQIPTESVFAFIQIRY